MRAGAIVHALFVFSLLIDDEEVSVQLSRTVCR